jgi:hypothetical protein
MSKLPPVKKVKRKVTVPTPEEIIVPEIEPVKPSIEIVTPIKEEFPDISKKPSKRGRPSKLKEELVEKEEEIIEEEDDFDYIPASPVVEKESEFNTIDPIDEYEQKLVDNISNFINTNKIMIGSARNEKSKMKWNLEGAKEINGETKTIQEKVFQQYWMKDGIFNIGSANAPHTVKTVAPHTGYLFDMSSFTNDEINRITSALIESNFLEKIEIELASAFGHITKGNLPQIENNENEPSVMQFEEWSKQVCYLDNGPIYWSMFSVNNPGTDIDSKTGKSINMYQVSCGDCSHDFEVGKSNRDIVFVATSSLNDINQADITSIRDGKDPMFLDSRKAYDRIYERKDPLKHSKFKVSFKIPSLYNVLFYLKLLRSQGVVPDKILSYIYYPYSETVRDRDILTDDELTMIITHKIKMYTHSVSVPFIERELKNNKTNKIEERLPAYATYTGSDNLNHIFGFMSILDLDDSMSLINKEMINLISKEGLTFKLADFNCPHCGKPQRMVPLDMRDIFFMGADGMVQKVREMILENQIEMQG